MQVAGGMSRDTKVMKTHTTLKTVRPLDKVATTLRGVNPLPTAQADELPMAAHAAPLANPDDSVQWRGEILQRYEAPMPRPWFHGGLND
jgi:hypothetical protein